MDKTNNIKHLMSIGEFSKISRASIKALHYYEQIGAFFPAYVDPDTRYRYYSINQIYELNLVRLCIEEGLDIKSIQDFYSEGDILQASELFKHCEKLASKRLEEARATVLRMEAYTKEYERQLRTNIHSEKKIELPARVLAVSPIAEASDNILYRGYLNSLSYCIKEVRKENYITLAQQGVMVSEDGWWYAYLEVASVEDMKPTERKDLRLIHRDAQKCKKKSMFGSDVERVFRNAINLRKRRDILYIQESWVYGTVIGTPAFDVYLK